MPKPDQFPVKKGLNKSNKLEELLVEQIFKNNFVNPLDDSRTDSNKTEKDKYKEILKNANTDIKNFLNSNDSIEDFINDPENMEKILALQSLINSAEGESYENHLSPDLYRVFQDTYREKFFIGEGAYTVNTEEELKSKIQEIKKDIEYKKKEYEENFNKIMEKIYSKDLNLDNLMQNIDKDNNSEIDILLNEYRNILEEKKYFNKIEREEIKSKIWNDKDELRGGRGMDVEYPSYVVYNSELTGLKEGYEKNLKNRMNATKQMYLLNQIEKKIENIFNKQEDVLKIPQNKPELDDSDKYWLSRYDDIKKLINNLNDEDNRIPQLKSQLEKIKDELSKRGIKSPELLLDKENNYKNEVKEKKKGFLKK